MNEKSDGVIKSYRLQHRVIVSKKGPRNTTMNSQVAESTQERADIHTERFDWHFQGGTYQNKNHLSIIQSRPSRNLNAFDKVQIFATVKIQIRNEYCRVNISILERITQIKEALVVYIRCSSRLWGTFHSPSKGPQMVGHRLVLTTPLITGPWALVVPHEKPRRLRSSIFSAPSRQ